MLFPFFLYAFSLGAFLDMLDYGVVHLGYSTRGRDRIGRVDGTVTEDTEGSCGFGIWMCEYLIMYTSQVLSAGFFYEWQFEDSSRNIGQHLSAGQRRAAFLVSIGTAVRFQALGPGRMQLDPCNILVRPPHVCYITNIYSPFNSGQS